MNISSSNSGNSSPEEGSDSASGRERRQRLTALHRKKAANPAFHSKIRLENKPADPEHSYEQKYETPGATGRRSAPSPNRAVSSRMFVLFALVALGVVLLSLTAGYVIGSVRGKAAAERQIVAARMQTLKRLPTAEAETLNLAVAGLRAGQAESSFATLKDLRAKFPQVASLSYLTALAALETGRYVVAETHVRDSIKAGQRVSDSLALLAMLESRKSPPVSPQKPGETDRKGEELLRAAITADAANPHPHIELANLLRVQGRMEEAEAEFRAAQALLTPVDSHLVVDLALAVMKVEQTPVGELAAVVPSPGDVRAIFPAAYAAMRRNDMVLAGALLAQCRNVLPPDLFDYLLSDPAVRKFADRQELRGFYAQR